MASDTQGWDEQDQSEVFDEDNLNEDGESTEFKTFEEIPDVFDVTQKKGDAEDDPELDEADFDPSAIDDEDLGEAEYETAPGLYEETDEEDVRDPDLEDGLERRAGDEVDLEFQPDVETRKGAQSSASHFESRGELGEDALRDLGYAEEREK